MTEAEKLNGATFELVAAIRTAKGAHPMVDVSATVNEVFKECRMSYRIVHYIKGYPLDRPES